MTTKYAPQTTPSYKRGATIAIPRRCMAYYFVCCDCGLVHRLDFQLTESDLLMTVASDMEATARERIWRKEHRHG